MPYKVVKTGNKFSVFKLGADNKPTGKALGSHPNMEKAQAQMKALYANEKKAKELPELKEGETITLDPGTYTLPNTIDLTGNVSGSTITKDYYGNPIEVTLVESSYGPLTFADLATEQAAREAQYEMYELTDQFGRLSRNIMNSDTEDKAAALVALANEYASLVGTRIQEEMTEEKSLSITKQIAGDNQPPKVEVKEEVPSDLVIWKEDGTYRWLAAYSNNRRDAEAEIITSESHKEFDKALDNNEWPMPEVYLWHIPYPVGITDYHAFDESTGFPVAAGHFYKECDWAAEGILKEKWDGVSHGMPDRWVKLDPNNEAFIVQHRTKEITFLPHWAAANKLSFSIISKEQSMSEIEKGLPAHKRPEFVKAFGEERVKQIEEALSAKSKEADEAGIDKKEVDTSQQVLTKEDLITGLEFVLTQVKEAVDGLGTRIEALEKTQVKEADTFDIVAQLKAKSIIGNPAAKLHGNTALAKDAPIETPSEEQKGPTPVGLLNNLFKANEAWANRGGR